MYNVLLKIGPVVVHGYGLMIAIGVICALLVADRRARSRGLNADFVFSMGMVAIVAGFAGAKLLYCIIEYKAFLSNPWNTLASGGFVVYGGLICGVLAAMQMCRSKKASFLQYFDLTAPSIALAQGFGRIGCFLAGCCYGRETNSFLGVVFPHSAIAPSGVHLLPTQLFSSAGDFAIAAILLLYARKDHRAGKVGALYLVLYSVGRFTIEFFRSDARGAVGALSTSQFISIFTLALGLALFLMEKYPWKKPQPEVG